MDETNGGGISQKKIYVTKGGLPLFFNLQWPFHKSTSGADFWVLHADVVLGNSDGLRAPVAVNLSATVREVMPSLEPKDAEAPVINALRKEVDRRQLEFLKTGKRVPVQFSTRHWDLLRNKWAFGKTADEQIEKLITRKVYWQTKLVGGDAWLSDIAEAMYVEKTTDELAHIAKELMDKGLIHMERRYARPTEQLMAQADQIEADMKAAMQELEKKHAFERG